MSNETEKKKSFSPTEYFGIILGMTRTLLVAWFVFNLVLVLGTWLVVRLTRYDVDPIKVDLANWLTKERIINLQDVAPGIQTVRHIFRMDTDSDDFEEWVVFYSYDWTEEGKGPYGAAVYDVDTCRPPAIVTYELRPYDYDYVTENLALRWTGEPKLRDVNADGKLELVLQFKDDMSVFRWFDNTRGCEVPGPGQQGYQLVGTFRGSGGVQIEGGGRVVVKDRGFFERSQMAVKKVYEPDDSGSYLRPEGGGLYDPKETGVDFTFGLPLTGTQLYYPEKAVLSFYLNLGQDNAEARSYLCADVKKTYPIKDHQFGIALPRDLVSRVLVKEIAYTPNVEAERLHIATSVTVTVVGIGTDGQADEAHPRRVTIGVRGVPEQGALPYNCTWCLESFEEVP